MITITITITENVPNALCTYVDPVKKDASELEVIAGTLYLKRINETIDEIKKASNAQYSIDAEGDSATRLNRQINP